jgi:hypothetical protein
MRFSTSGFFHQTTSPRPLIHGIKNFAYGLEFAKIFDFEIADFGHSGVNDTAQTALAVSLTLLRYRVCRVNSRIRSHIRKGFNP